MELAIVLGIRPIDVKMSAAKRYVREFCKERWNLQLSKIVTSREGPTGLAMNPRKESG